MPATYTHHAFTKDVYKVLDKSVKEKLSKSEDLFNLFGKSFDVLFFSREKLGHFAHKNHVNLYFQNIMRYIKDNDLINNGDVLAYLYGSVCHYVLDSTIHPYVYFKAGRYYQNNKETWKYKGRHTYVEYMIDAYMYKEKNEKSIVRAKLSKEMFPTVEFDKNLRKTIDYAYMNTFCASGVSEEIIKGYRNYRFIMKHIMESHFGIKDFLYRLIDKLGIVKKWVLKNYSYYIKEIDESVLNLEHNKWFYPVDKKVSFHYSVNDLYDLCIERARTLINNIDEALNGDEKMVKEVLKDIGDLSYTTGKKWDKEFKNWEYEF